jgi:hypothetical protein
MHSFVSIITTVLCFALLCTVYWFWMTKPARKNQGPTPAPTMFDVRRLLKEGDREGAIRCYAKIFKVSSKQARKDIEQLERSLKV